MFTKYLNILFCTYFPKISVFSTFASFCSYFLTYFNMDYYFHTKITTFLHTSQISIFRYFCLHLTNKRFLFHLRLIIYFLTFSYYKYFFANFAASRRNFLFSIPTYYIYPTKDISLFSIFCNYLPYFIPLK